MLGLQYFGLLVTGWLDHSIFGSSLSQVLVIETERFYGVYLHSLSWGICEPMKVIFYHVCGEERPQIHRRGPLEKHHGGVEVMDSQSQRKGHEVLIFWFQFLIIVGSLEPSMWCNVHTLHSWVCFVSELLK